MIGNSAYVDLMLTLVMVAVGLRSLILSRDTGARTAARWREELRALEGSLKSLITEASNSSATLDRRLVRRREELEALLKRIDGQAAKLESHVDEMDEEGDLYESHEELPNESWFMEEPPVKTVRRAAEASSRTLSTKSTTAPKKTKPTRDMFLELSEEVEDTVELSTPVRRASAKSAAAAPVQRRAAQPQLPAPAKGIHSEVEIEDATVKKARSKSAKPKVTKPTTKKETEILSTPSIIDPTTYAVARRLLARGTELHVVARKLEIPLSEIRLLDKLMRSEGDGRATEEEISAGYRKTERVPAKKIVRPAQPDDDVINLDDVEIFRETTTV